MTGSLTANSLNVDSLQYDGHKITSNNLDGLEDIISFKLNRYFPNINVDSLEILQQTDNNTITVDLKYSIKNTNIYDTVELNCE